MGVFLLLLYLLVPGLLAFIFLPRTLLLLGQLVGYRLRRASQTRRELLLERTATEQRKYDAEHKKSKREEDDWEEIEPSTVGSAVNGGKADQDWNGIVGFFHPFWYIFKGSYDSLESDANK